MTAEKCLFPCERFGMNLIETNDRLEALCNRLSEARFITVDTEFQRTSTFYSKLCLIQVADDHGEAAIDALAPEINPDIATSI